MNIDVSDFGAKPDGSDSTPAVRAALLDLRKSAGGKRLVFPKGRYEFWPDMATEDLLFISNNDSGLKRIAFDLKDFQDGIEIDGQGSEFVFHKQMTPFAVRNSREVVLKNFSVDFKRPFHNEADVLNSGEGFVDLSFDKNEFPFEIVDGKLLFKDEDGKRFESGRILVFDAAKREPAFMTHENYDFQLKPRTKAELMPDGSVRLFANYGEPRPKRGERLVFGSVHRNCPGIFLERSQEVKILDVEVRHAGGMALVAQRCENIRLECYAATPAKNRIVSATADATHFVNCKGRVELFDCVFENQLDDATNVHGTYARIRSVTSRRKLDLQLVHPQQKGVFFIEAGDLVEIVDSKSLLTVFKGEVESVGVCNSERFSIEFKKDIPLSVKAGDAVGNATWNAELHARGCVVRANRARGFLISTPEKVVVERCKFRVEGPAVHISGDANYWFESGAVNDVSIRDNDFDLCNYNDRGWGVVNIEPELSKELKEPVPYHKSVRVEGNRFKAFSKRLLYARGTDGLTFAGNMIEPAQAWSASESVELDRCSNSRIDAQADGEG